MTDLNLEPRRDHTENGLHECEGGCSKALIENQAHESHDGAGESCTGGGNISKKSIKEAITAELIVILKIRI